MRIGIDARPLAGSLTGIGVYLSELYGVMVEAHPGTEFIFYAHRDFEHPVLSRARNARIVKIAFPGNIWVSRIWEQTLLPKRLDNDLPDLFHSARTCVPGGFADRTVVTIHDLAFMHYPEIMPWRYRAYWTNQMKRASREAAALIAVSEATRRDLEEMFPESQGRVEVVLEAADERAFLPGGGDDQFTLRRYGIENPYILFVGTLEPRKGIRTLLDAWLLLPKNIASGLNLLFAGKRGWLIGDTGALIDDLGPHVRELGYVPDADLRALYRHCEFYVLPSRYEGFGLTVLEAMAAGAPVITTTAGSLPEVAGDAALLIEPDDPAALANAMMKLLMDSSIREEYARRGRERARQFSWERAAEETFAVFERLATR